MRRILFVLALVPLMSVAQTENPPADVPTVRIIAAPFSYDPTKLVLKWDLTLENKESTETTVCSDCVID